MTPVDRGDHRVSSVRWYRSWQVWAVGLVLLYLATAMAGWNRALNWDEIWLVTNAGRPFDVQLRLIRADISHPPLFYLIARGWIAVFGGSDTAVKVLPLVIGVITLVAFTVLARRVTRHWRVATLLFSGIYWQVDSVPNLVRAYGLVCLLTILAILAWRNWVDDGRARWLVGWTAAVTGVSLLHYFGVLLVPAFVLMNAVCGRRPLQLLGAATVPALVLAPWALYLLPAYSAESGIRPESLTWISGSSVVSDLADLAFGFMVRTEPGAAPYAPWIVFDDDRIHRLAMAGAVAAHAVLVVILGAGWIRRRKAGRMDERFAEWLPVLSILFIVPVIALVALSRLEALFHPRFLMGLLPVYWLLFALAADAAPRIGRLFAWALVAWLGVAAMKVTQQSLRPWPVSAAVRQIESQAQPDDIILADYRIGAYVWWELDRVLHRDRDLNVFRMVEGPGIPQRERRGNNILPYMELEEVELTGIETVWLVHSHRAAYDLASEYLTNAGFHTVERESIPAIVPTRFTRVHREATADQHGQ